METAPSYQGPVPAQRPCHTQAAVARGAARTEMPTWGNRPRDHPGLRLQDTAGLSLSPAGHGQEGPVEGPPLAPGPHAAGANGPGPGRATERTQTPSWLLGGHREGRPRPGTGVTHCESHRVVPQRLARALLTGRSRSGGEDRPHAFPGSPPHLPNGQETAGHPIGPRAPPRRTCLP